MSSKKRAVLKKDPRFQKVSKKKTKVVVGDRFARMFTDKDFQEEASSLPTDKYGIRKPAAPRGRTISKLYAYDPDHEKSDDEADRADREPSVEASDSEERAGDQVEEDEEEEGPQFAWDEESSSTDIEDSDNEPEVEDPLDEDEEDIPDGEETKRIAIVNLDWDHIRAMDIYHVLRAFLPKDTSSKIEKVSIIPSLFGLERMRQEAQQGPSGIWNEDGSDNDDDDTPHLLTAPTRKQMLKADRDAFDQDKLRKYQKERLRYYFAVVECNSAATALLIYQACNDVEIEQTSNRFDMRFIPDDVEFEESQVPKDVATGAPLDHELPEFHTKALQHTRVKLTWDQDDPERIKLTKKLRDDSLYNDNLYLPLAEERKLKRYLANSDSESSDDESDDEQQSSKKKRVRKDVRKKYSSLLQEIHGGETQAMFGQSSADPSMNMDMEVTFTPGLTDNVQNLVDRTLANDTDKSSWDLHLEKLAEKKRLKKQARKLRLQKEKQDELEERERKKKERRKKKKTTTDDEVDPELALLASGTHKRKTMDDADSAEIDPRFGQVVTNPKDFGFDRTNPQYKAASSFVKKVHEQRGSKSKKGGEHGDAVNVQRLVEKLRSAPPAKKRKTK